MFSQETNVEVCQVDINEDKFDSSIYLNKNYVVPRISEEHESICESFGKSFNLSWINEALKLSSKCHKFQSLLYVLYLS